MRIAFSGAACTGKTTTIAAFLNKWRNYSLLNSNYRKIVKGTKRHSKNTSTKTQKSILNVLTEECKTFTLHDKVCYDRCPLDNLVYTLWAYGKGIKGFNESFVQYTIEQVRESMRCFDIIFICTRDMMPPLIEKNNIRETDPLFVQETNNLFKEISKQAQNNLDKSPFFPKDDSPTLIDIHGTTEERIAQIALYVTEEGNAFGEDQSILNMDEINKMYSLLVDQKESLTDEQKEKPSILHLNK
jgi:hypothetical protein